MNSALLRDLHGVSKVQGESPVDMEAYAKS